MVTVLGLVTLVVVTSLAITLWAARAGNEEQGEQRALAIARSAASDPRYAAWVTAGPPDTAGPTQTAAEELRRRTEALYVVITDDAGIRYSHPEASLIGERVSTDPTVPLAGGEVIAIERGTLGLSARGKVPLLDAEGRIVGTVSVGIALSEVDRLQQRATLLIAGIGVGALVVSLVGVWLLSRQVGRATHGLEPDEMADLLREHAAVLGGALDGVVAVDAGGRVRLANDAARRYTGAEFRVGQPVEETGLPPAVVDLLREPSAPGGEGGLVVVGDHLLQVKRANVEREGRNLGAVAILSDRTDLDGLARELEATRALTDALRAQAHEYTNRLHALSGMLQLGHHEDALEYLHNLTGAAAWAHGVADPYLEGILAAKTAAASEHGVDLRISDATWVAGRLSRPLDAVTVVGNLVDNATRAAAAGQRRPAWVEVSLLSDTEDLLVHVADSGDGVPPGREDAVFAGGWTTKIEDGSAHGIGLALARVVARRHGGDVELLHGRGTGHGAVFAARLPGAMDRDPRRHPRTSPSAEGR